MRRFYQAVVDIVRGGVHPREVALAVSLGLLAGFLSGWNLCLGAVLLAVVILNVPTKVFGQTWALGWAISWSLTPASYTLGHWLLSSTPLGSLLAPWREHPLLVLFDLDRYTVLGGGALALMLVFPAAWLAARVTLILQSKFFEIHRAIEARTQWHGSVLVRIGCWMIFGDAAKPVPAPAVNPDWIRRRGLMLALGLFVPAGVLGCYLAPGLTADGLLAALSTANQSEVNAGQVRLSFGNGLLEIEDLQVSDPDHPDRDRLRVGYLAAQVRPGPLLRGRMHVDRLMMENIAADVARQSRARPYGVRLPSIDETAIQDLLPDVNVSGPELIDLQEHLANWEALRERLHKLQELLAKIDALAEKIPGAASQDGEDFDPSKHAPASYLAMREARHGFGRAEPRVWIELAAIKGLAAPFGIGPQGSIELANVSSQPVLVGQPTVVAIKAPRLGTEIVATLNLHQPKAPHELKFQARGIDLAGLIHAQSARSPVAIQGGTINLAGRGWITTKDIELTVAAELTDLNLQVSAQSAVAGLPPQLWSDGLAQLQQLQTEATITGAWTSPKLRVDADRLVQQFKQQLLAAGQVALAKAIDEQVARGEALVDQSLAKAEAAVDRQTAKAEAAVDRTAARAEQAVDGAAARVDGAVAKGEAQIAGVQQRVEQSAAGVQATADRYAGRAQQTQDRYAAQAQQVQDRYAAQARQAQDRYAAQARQTAQQWQNPLGAAGQLLQENVAASALTSPGNNPNNSSQPSEAAPRTLPVAEEGLAEETRRRGPPPLQYGDVVGAAAIEQPTMTAAAEPPATQPSAPQPNATVPEGMRYPESVRSYAQPAVPQMVEINPANGQRVAVEASPPNRPASFNGPPAAMELGYEARRPTPPQSVAAATPIERRLPAAPPSYPTTSAAAAHQPPATTPRAALPEYPSPAISIPDEPSVASRIGNWSRGVGGKVKGIMPWSRDTAEASVSDEGVAPVGQRPPAASTQTATAPQPESPPADTPWYRRMWR